MVAASPFPFGALTRWRRRDVALLRAASRRLAPPPHAAAPLDLAWAPILGAPLALRAEAPTLVPRDEALRRAARTSLCAVFELPSGAVALCVCDRPFALALAQRALGAHRDDPSVTFAPHDTLAPAWEGALAVLASRLAAALSHASPPPVLRAVTDDIEGAFEALGPADPVLAWPWRAAVGELAGRGALVCAPALALRLAPASVDVVGRLGAVRVPVSVVAGHARWRPDELTSLRAGEVIAMEHLHAAPGVLRGPLALRVGAAGDHGCAVTLRDARAVTLTTPPEPRMDEPTDHDARLGAITVDVTVELARGAFALAEVAAWRAGEVVAFDAPLGEPVTLRAGGRVVARGELVDVEGVVGVRLTEVL